jgi:hypothetical protein
LIGLVGAVFLFILPSWIAAEIYHIWNRVVAPDERLRER